MTLTLTLTVIIIDRLVTDDCHVVAVGLEQGTFAVTVIVGISSYLHANVTASHFTASIPSLLLGKCTHIKRVAALGGIAGPYP